MPNPDYISESLHPLIVPISEVQGMDDNARIHNQRCDTAIRKSLERFKQVKPIVLAADGKTVIAGNGTLSQAQELGWEYIAVSKTELSGADAKAYAIADNRTTDLSVFDGDIVRDTLDNLDSDLKDIAGFDEIELNQAFGPRANPNSQIFAAVQQEAQAQAAGFSNAEEWQQAGAPAALPDPMTPPPPPPDGTEVVPATEPFATLIVTGPRPIIEECRERLGECRDRSGAESLAHALEKIIQFYLENSDAV